MVDVAAPHREIVERPYIVADRNGQAPHHQHRSEETERRQEKPFPPRFNEPMLIDLTQPGAGDDHGKTTENRRDQDRQNPKTRMGPEHSYFDLGTLEIGDSPALLSSRNEAPGQNRGRDRRRKRHRARYVQTVRS